MEVTCFYDLPTQQFDTHQAGCWSPGCGGETAAGPGLMTTGFHWRAAVVGSVWTASSPQCCRPAIGQRKRHYGNKRESRGGVRQQFCQQKAEGDVSVGGRWKLRTPPAVQSIDCILQETHPRFTPGTRRAVRRQVQFVCVSWNIMLRSAGTLE